MKYLIFALISIPFQSLAGANECKSVWVFTAFKTCAAAANGLDLSQPGPTAMPIKINSEWLSGGQSQEKVCADVRDKFNAGNLEKGLRAETARPTPSGEKSEDRLVQQQYQYVCDLNVKQYPFKSAASAACGAEDKISYQNGGPAPLGQSVSCLSCDHLSASKPSVMVNCLRENIEKIVQPKAIELRDTDLQALSAQASRMIKLSRQVPIENLQTTDQLSFFTDFIEKHPAQ